MSSEEHDALLETLEILSDSTAMERIRNGLDEIPALTKKNPADAQKKALDLYITRQDLGVGRNQ